MKNRKQGPLPESDYYAVIFSYTRGSDLEGFEAMDELTLQLANEIDGFLGYESVGNETNGIFISYWESEDAIAEWRKHATHQEAIGEGIARWYDRYLSQVCHVKRGHEFVRED